MIDMQLVERDGKQYYALPVADWVYRALLSPEQKLFRDIEDRINGTALCSTPSARTPQR